MNVLVLSRESEERYSTEELRDGLSRGTWDVVVYDQGGLVWVMYLGVTSYVRLYTNHPPTRDGHFASWDPNLGLWVHTPHWSVVVPSRSGCKGLGACTSRFLGILQTQEPSGGGLGDLLSDPDLFWHEVQGVVSRKLAATSPPGMGVHSSWASYARDLGLVLPLRDLPLSKVCPPGVFVVRPNGSCWDADGAYQPGGPFARSRTGVRWILKQAASTERYQEFERLVELREQRKRFEADLADELESLGIPAKVSSNRISFQGASKDRLIEMLSDPVITRRLRGL